ncbi:unnamed protein product, partial [Nesidiocoris tenuis]
MFASEVHLPSLESIVNLWNPSSISGIHRPSQASIFHLWNPSSTHGTHHQFSVPGIQLGAISGV